MNFLKKLLNNKEESAPAMAAEPGTVYAPLSGTAITLAEIGDGVFSEGILGPGCGIRPAEETVYAPFDGTVIQVADTKHAIGIASKDGIELLIHVGLDTVAMKGKGFQVYVSCGDHVSRGQKLLKFSKKEIAAAGYFDTTAVLVTNSDEYSSVEMCTVGEVSPSDKLLTVK